MRAPFVALGVAACAWLSGCGGVQYAAAANGAASRLEEAKAVGAEQLAPYEYYYAKEHLEQAQVEAAEASYSDAVALARKAEQYATRAIDLAESARRARP